MLLQFQTSLTLNPNILMFHAILLIKGGVHFCHTVLIIVKVIPQSVLDIKVSESKCVQILIKQQMKRILMSTSVSFIFSAHLLITVNYIAILLLIYSFVIVEKLTVVTFGNVVSYFRFFVEYFFHLFSFCPCVYLLIVFIVMVCLSDPHHQLPYHVFHKFCKSSRILI